MIEPSLLQQVKGIYTALESQYVLRLEADPAHESFAEFKEFLNDFASTSDHIAVEVVETPGTLRMVHPWRTRVYFTHCCRLQR